jgi:hypothetical protein
LKQILKIFLVLVFPLLANSYSSYAQISRLKGGNSGQDESSSDTPNQGNDKEKSSASPDTAKCSYFYPNLQAAYTLKPFKAPLHGFNNYNPLQKGQDIYAFLGNAGSAASPITYQMPTVAGFSFVHGAFDLYKIRQDSIRFYMLDKPFSEINYVMGKGKEQQLLFTHSQQIRKGLYLGLYARFANSPGLYQRQRTFYSTGYFTARYTLPSGRYGVLTSFLTDRFRNFENGGIAQDSIFTHNMENNRKTIAVKLPNAMNRDKSSGFYFQQYFNLQRQQGLIAKVKDSTGQKRNSQQFNAGRLIHTFKYYRNTFAYEDDKSRNGIIAGYYPNTYGDTTLTLDSTFHIHIENTFVYSNIEPDTASRNFPFQYSFGISQQYDRVGYTSIAEKINQVLPNSVFSTKAVVSERAQSEHFTQLIPFGTLKGIIARKTFFVANGRLSLGGYNAGDYELSGSFYQFLGSKGKTGRIYLTVAKGKVHPDYIFQHFISDHIRWENNFSMQDYINGIFGVEILGYNLSLGITRLSNYTWLNANAVPQQDNTGLTISRADFSKIFHPGKWIIDGRVTLQKVTESSLLQLPDLVGRFAISYNLFLFKKVMHAQIGLGCLYYTSYHADAYHPELRMFYRQDEILTGNYPYADAFLNLRVKRARIFIKYQHFNAGWLDHSYFMVPHYPGDDAALKAGVSWVFYD